MDADSSNLLTSQPSIDLGSSDPNDAKLLKTTVLPQELLWIRTLFNQDNIDSHTLSDERLRWVYNWLDSHNIEKLQSAQPCPRWKSLKKIWNHPNFHILDDLNSLATMMREKNIQLLFRLSRTIPGMITKTECNSDGMIHHERIELRDNGCIFWEGKEVRFFEYLHDLQITHFNTNRVMPIIATYVKSSDFH